MPILKTAVIWQIRPIHGGCSGLTAPMALENRDRLIWSANLAYGDLPDANEECKTMRIRPSRNSWSPRGRDGWRNSEMPDTLSDDRIDHADSRKITSRAGRLRTGYFFFLSFSFRFNPARSNSDSRKKSSICSS